MTDGFDLWGFKISVEQVVVEVVGAVIIAMASTIFNYARTRFANISRRGRIEKYKNLKMRYALAHLTEINIEFRTNVMVLYVVFAIKVTMKFLGLLAVFIYLLYTTSEMFLLKNCSEHYRMLHHYRVPHLESQAAGAQVIISLTIVVVLGFGGRFLNQGLFFINKAVETGLPMRTLAKLQTKISKVRKRALRARKKVIWRRARR